MMLVTVTRYIGDHRKLSGWRSWRPRSLLSPLSLLRRHVLALPAPNTRGAMLYIVHLSCHALIIAWSSRFPILPCWPRVFVRAALLTCILPGLAFQALLVGRIASSALVDLGTAFFDLLISNSWLVGSGLASTLMGLAVHKEVVVFPSFQKIENRALGSYLAYPTRR